jgi:hypothetical protein
MIETIGNNIGNLLIKHKTKNSSMNDAFVFALNELEDFLKN